MNKYNPQTRDKEAYQSSLTTSSMLNNIDEPIWVVDTNLCYIYANNSFKENYLRDVGQELSIGKDVRECLKDDMLSFWEGHYQRGLMGEKFQFEFHCSINNINKFYEISVAPIYNEGEELIAISLIRRDISNLKESQIQLQKNNALLNAVINSPSQTCVFSLDTDYCYTSFNENHKNSMKNHWACEIEIGGNMLDYINIGESREKAKLNFDRVFMGESFHITEEYGDASHKFYYENAYNPIKDEEDKIIGLTVFLFNVSSLKRTESALIKSQKETNILFEHSFDAAFLVEESSLKIIRCNKKAVSLFEVENKQHITHVLGYEHFIPEDMDYAEVKSILNEGKIWQQDLEFVTAKGNIFWGNLSLKKVILASNMGFFIMTISDISKRKATEQKLFEKQKQLEAIIENTHDYIWLVDTHYCLLTANSAFKNFILDNHNVQLEEGISLIEGLPKFKTENKNWWQNAYNEALSGYAVIKEYSFQVGKKRHYWENSLHPVKQENTIIGVAVLARNITERKLVELELQSQQKFIKKVINTVPSLIFVKDVQGRFILVNKAFAAYYGTTVQNLIGKKDVDLLNKEEYLSYFDSSDQEVLTTGKLINLPESKTINKQTGEVSYYQTVKVLLNVGKGEKQILGVATNISERKKTDAEKVKLVESLMQTIQDLEQFTYMVSHNLRSHVARILGLTSLLDEKNKGNPFNNYIFTTVASEATRLDEIISDLNTILTVRNNNDEKRESINLKNIIQSVLLSLQNDLDKCEAKIELNIPESINIYTIKTYTYSIILNLLSNAIKYRNPHQLLHISVKAYPSDDKQFICFAVKDNGLGMNLAENKEKVFGLYRRFHSHVEGKGIGLHITKTQIERMGGKIEVESELNKGTKFVVYFPIKT